jgi:hypothetical protein
MGLRLFLVDGTNLVRTAYGYGGPAHRAQEELDTERLVAIFARLQEDAGAAAEFELFFDGPYRDFPAARAAGLRVTYSREGPADDLILDRVRARAWDGGGKATVVTADAELGRETQAEGGRWMRVAHGTPPERVARDIGGRFTR